MTPEEANHILDLVRLGLDADIPDSEILWALWATGDLWGRL
jgi:hypothetical protein